MRSGRRFQKQRPENNRTPNCLNSHQRVLRGSFFETQFGGGASGPFFFFSAMFFLPGLSDKRVFGRDLFQRLFFCAVFIGTDYCFDLFLGIFFSRPCFFCGRFFLGPCFFRSVLFFFSGFFFWVRVFRPFFFFSEYFFSGE